MVGRIIRTEADVAEASMHWTFGMLAGAIYGAAVELTPAFREGFGVPFGTAVFGIMHEGILPAAGVEEPHAAKDDAEERNELITHLVYGVATELVRRFVRAQLARRLS